jgi:carbamoyl-phosphate synthase large subunit
MWRVLIFPSATEIALEIRESLTWCKDVQLFSASSAGSNHAPFAFARHFSVPPVSEPGWEAALQRVAQEQAITHIFPAHDDAVLALARNAGFFNARIVGSPLKTCEITRSKSATLRHLADVIPVPRLYHDINEIEEYPVFLKPDRGQASQRIACARSRSELEALLLQDGERIMLEFLPGREFTVDCFSDREKGLIYASGRSRDRIRGGIAMDSREIVDSRFAEIAHKINASLELHGAWFFQLKGDADGGLKLLEVAPRIAGTSALSRARGVNLPLLSLYEAERIPVRVTPCEFHVQIDRALRNRYRHNLDFEILYVDFDDTLIVGSKVNSELMKLLYQALNQGIRLVLLTRHAGDLQAALALHRVAGVFDEIIHLRADQSKAAFIREKRAILIDDSFRERTEVHERTGIPVFDLSMIDVLCNERS